MLILLENSENDLNALIKALIAEGIKKELIRPYKKLEDATRALNRFHKQKKNAIAIISDVGLDNERHTGIDFISEHFHRFKDNTGSGVWTVLISVENLERRNFSALHPLPHWTYFKDKPNWAEVFARQVKRQFFSSFEFDEDNDFAPPPKLEIRPPDRIYLYSCGEAAYLTPNLNIDAEEYFIFRRVKKRDQGEENPILMHRGYYLYTEHFKKTVSPKLVRVLLRWRTAALACAAERTSGKVKEVFRDYFSIRHICSWQNNSDDSEIDEEQGFPIKSINNDMGAFRNQEEVRRLDTLLFPTAKTRILDGFPSTRVLTGLKKVTRNEPVLTLLKMPFVNNDQGVEDNFLTRIHFVLSASEVQNYNRWKEDWTKYYFNQG